jgi:hypothetical protein
MAYSHPSTTLFSAVTLAISGAQTSSVIDCTAGAGALIEVRVTVPSGTQTGTILVQPQHSPDGTATFYSWGPQLQCNNIAVPVTATAGFFDWIAPAEGGKWQFVVTGAVGAACTLDGRGTVLTPG